MRLQIKNKKIIIRPQNEYEESICRNLLRGSRFTLIKRVEDFLYFKPTNMILFDHDELRFEEIKGKLILRPLTKEAEQVCAAILGGGGFSIIERIAPSGIVPYLRSIATNPETGNPWIIDAKTPRKDMTFGDFENE